MTAIVEKDKDVNILTNKFLKRLNGIIDTSFKKTRSKEDNNDTNIMKLFDRRCFLRSKTDDNSKKELLDIESELADKCAESNYKKIMEEINNIECDEGGFNMGKLWKLKKK